jgi:hypothetical protein
MNSPRPLPTIGPDGVHSTVLHRVSPLAESRRVAPAVAPASTPTSETGALEEFFDAQPTPTAELPNPIPLMENLARCVLEVLAGARELDQLARWVSDDVYRHLLKRVVLSTRARQARGASVVRPTFRIGNTLVCEPRDGVVEGVVIAHGKARTRAIAIRLEGLDSRWRASAINVL